MQCNQETINLKVLQNSASLITQQVIEKWRSPQMLHTLEFLNVRMSKIAVVPNLSGK